jgi:hypothetical protein
MKNDQKIKSNPSGEGFWDEKSTKTQMKSFSLLILG